MSSPNAFLCSPRRGRREYHQVRSSSPDLPPLLDLLSQKPARPKLRSGSKAAPIPQDAETGFVSAGSLWRSIEANEGSAGDDQIPKPSIDASHDADDSITIVQIKPKARQTKPRKPRTRKQPQAKPENEEERAAPGLSENDKPWMKYQSPSKSTGAQLKDTRVEPRQKDTSGAGKKKTETTSRYFTPEPEKASLGPPARKEMDLNEPLHIEPALARRADWTPPAQKTVIQVDSDSSALRPLESSGAGFQAAKFKDLLQGYACEDVPRAEPLTKPQETTTASDEDPSFLKKRKLIELVVTKNASPDISTVIEKSPVKQKAPKKKPRTITAIATAAYKPATQPDPNPPPSLVEYLAQDNKQSEGSAPQPTKKAAKSKPKKRPSKKKAAPPKPILLSPGAALAQVAGQDFVFGTSSQLAREPSPTVLRDLQAAIRNSYENRDYEFDTQINSDTIEPLEQRPKLWNAGARDAGGDLFDIEVIDLVDASTELPTVDSAADPFGYSKDNNVPGPSNLAQSVQGDDASIDLPPILSRPQKTAEDLQRDQPLLFSDSDVSVSSNVPRRRAEPHHESQKPETKNKNVKPPPQSQSGPNDASSLPQHPRFDLYTDAMLAKEVKSYGFKPVKQRTASIALLTQCWESKARAGQASLHTSASQSMASKPQKPTEPVTAAKKPRGRPKKAVVEAPEPQEPPPSAQPASSPSPKITPKRPRGRPRKDSLNLSPISQTRAKGQVSKKTSSRPASPKRKRATSKNVIEIPDSASENESILDSPPLSSPERIFSSPPKLDLSLGDETELSLTASPSDHEAALFVYITKAVTSAPRTTDPADPSWHEKILLYDPIVLEDLTTWLNAGQLTRVGYDGETNPVEVKKWCESKSICCLWKTSLRGKERKRF